MTRSLAATQSRAATGGRDTWETPLVVLERVRALGPIALDPCTSSDNPVGAHAWFTEAEDGLAEDWDDSVHGLHSGLCFVNPPYSRAAAWALKVVGEAGRGCEVVTLVAARPDARWFRALVWDSAQAVCFWAGRLRFVGAPSSAPFPSAVVYHGHRPASFEACFEKVGAVVRLRPGR